MLNLGMSEILLFAIIALIVLGPDKLPEAARFAGRWYGKIKRMVNSVQNDIDRELRLSELREQMQQELEKIKVLEAKMQAQYQQIQQHEVISFNPKIISNDDETHLHRCTGVTYQFCPKHPPLAPFCQPRLEKNISKAPLNTALKYKTVV